MDPLFTSLKKSMMEELDKGRPDETSVDGFDEKQFFDQYLSESRPLVVKRQASDWNATQKWTDRKYISKLFGFSLVEFYATNFGFNLMTPKKLKEM